MAQPDLSQRLNSRRHSCPKAAFLVGFMGAGKTTVGHEIARILHWKFIDLDDRIEEADGRSIPRIFAESGEHDFRGAEARTLALVISELQSGLNAVVALGGGAFCQPQNAEAIRATELPTVFLDAPVEELRRRCAPKGSSRPLFQDQSAFYRLYEERRDSYMQADFRVNTAGKSVAAVAAEVVTFLGVRNS